MQPPSRSRLPERSRPELALNGTVGFITPAENCQARSTPRVQRLASGSTVIACTSVLNRAMAYVAVTIGARAVESVGSASASAIAKAPRNPAQVSSLMQLGSKRSKTLKHPIGIATLTYRAASAIGMDRAASAAYRSAEVASAVSSKPISPNSSRLRRLSVRSQNVNSRSRVSSDIANLRPRFPIISPITTVAIGADRIAVEASSTVAGLRYALRSLSPGGTCTAVGYYFARNSGVPLLHMYANSTTLKTGISNVRAFLPAVVEFIASGRFDPLAVATLVADWEDAPAAFTTRATKVIVRRPDLR